MRLSAVERDELASTARRVLIQRSTSEAVRSLLDDPIGYRPELFVEMNELGWAASMVAESLGGYGVSLGDTYSVLIELGRALVGGPLVTSAVVAGGVLAAAPVRGEAAVAALAASGIADGTSIVTVAMAGPGGHCTAAGLGVTCTGGRDGYVLDGQAHFVSDVTVADRAVVFARAVDGAVDGVVAVVVDLRDDAGRVGGVRVDGVPLADQTRRAGTVAFDALHVDVDHVLAVGGDGDALLDVTVDLAATAAALDSFGVGELVLERTTEYVKQRHQFGRPIGSFQAIKHRLADAVLLIETSRVALIAAAEAVSPTDPAPSGERMIAASTAKAYVGDAMARICREALQTHGGIGFTWEHDMHLHLKRVLLNQALYGTSRWHRRRVADLVLAPPG
jgi:alkylation response protein AidB-like acyl-CoA dehydrogenase